MFLHISDKLKKCRQHFGLSQSAFSKYGISQNYISMIESKRREPSQSVIQSLYIALDSLTDGQIIDLYSEDEFLLTVNQQVRIYIKEALSKERDFLTQINYCLSLTIEYKLFDLQYEINFSLGNYYKVEKNHNLSIKFYLEASKIAVLNDINPCDCYAQIGLNYTRILDYKSALTYYLLAIHYTEEESELYYKLTYELIALYIESNQLDKVPALIEEVLSSCPIPKIKAATLLLKAHYHGSLAEYNLEQQVLSDFINNPPYKPYLGYAYHNLSSSYYNAGLYVQALTLIEQTLSQIDLSEEYVISLFLKAKIYQKISDFKGALNLYLSIKDNLSKHKKKLFLAEWYERVIEIYLHFDDFKSIELLLTEVKELSMTQTLPISILQDLKLKLVNLLLTKCSDSYHKYSSILQI